MSESDVQVVRRMYAAMNAGDEETIVSLVDPEIVIDATRFVFNPNTYVGLQGIREMSRGINEVWESVRFEPLEFVDTRDRVVVVERMIGKGKGSGVEVARTLAAVWTVRDGRIARMELGFADLGAALA